MLLENLVLVAGHAVHLGRDFVHPERDEGWCLQPFQRGEPPVYLDHMRDGVERTAQDPASLLVFSGGQTRREAGLRSEARSYWQLAEHAGWWSHPQVASRASTEDHARDSFENLLFGICRFRECTGRYPHFIQVVSWAFKAERFVMHLAALRWPPERFAFRGVGNPVDLAAAVAGEAKTVAAFRADPFGTGAQLGAKRVARNPFGQIIPYATTCPELAQLLEHSGAQPFAEALPWS